MSLSSKVFSGNHVDEPGYKILIKNDNDDNETKKIVENIIEWGSMEWSWSFIRILRSKSPMSLVVLSKVRYAEGLAATLNLLSIKPIYDGDEDVQKDDKHNDKVNSFHVNDNPVPKKVDAPAKKGKTEGKGKKEVIQYVVEYQSNDDDEKAHANIVAEKALDLCLNYGVVGALIISVLFPMVINGGGTISDEAISFFTPDGAQIIFYIYMILINIAIAMAVFTLMFAANIYKLLSFWMITPRAKTRFIRDHTYVTTLIVLSTYVPLFLSIAIPFGTAVIISPIVGAISAISVLSMWLCYVFGPILGSELASNKILHDEVRLTFDIRCSCDPKGGVCEGSLNICKKKTYWYSI